MADAVLVAGVLFLGWSPVRPVCFYFLELVSVIIAFMVFMGYREGFIFFPFNILGALLLVFVYSMLMKLMLLITGVLPDPEMSLTDFYAPYYDVGIYLVVLVVMRVEDVRQYLSLPDDGGVVAFRFTLATELLLIPMLLFAVAFTQSLTGNPALGLVIPLSVMRTWMIWKRKKDIRKYGHHE
ncbi:MAG: hypothetical protein ACK5XV_01660 [Flavobacteriales bacterium]|jgi:hypothetical protein